MIIEFKYDTKIACLNMLDLPLSTDGTVADVPASGVAGGRQNFIAELVK